MRNAQGRLPKQRPRPGINSKEGIAVGVHTDPAISSDIGYAISDRRRVNGRSTGGKAPCFSKPVNIGGAKEELVAIEGGTAIVIVSYGPARHCRLGCCRHRQADCQANSAADSDDKV